MADSKQNSPTNKNYTAGICQEMVSLRYVFSFRNICKNKLRKQQLHYLSSIFKHRLCHKIRLFLTSNIMIGYFLQPKTIG